MRPGRPTARSNGWGPATPRYLSTEVATGFTGVYLGCYATGNGEESDERARFTDFEYAPTAE